MRKFLVVLCTMAMVFGTITPTPIFAASSVYDEDGDVIENPWGEIFTTTPEETTTEEITTVAVKVLNTLSNVQAAAGEKVTFTVEAQGTNITYQWQMSTDNGATWTNTTASGAKTATLSFKMSESLNGRLVRCVVTDEAGNTAVSNGAKVSVKEAETEETTTPAEEETTAAPKTSTKIRIRVQPKNVVSKNGDTVRLMISAESSIKSELSYQWQISSDGGITWKNSTSSGSKTNQMQFTMSKTLNGRMARCVVTDAEGNVTETNSATITTGTPESLSIVTQPSAVTAQIGEWAFASIEATGNGVMYRWQVSSDNGRTWNNTSSKGFNSDTVFFRMVKSFNGKMIRCVVVDANLNTVTSQAVSISIGKGTLKVVSQPYSVSSAIGETVVFSTSVAGTGLKYQWQISKDNGATWSNSSSAGSKTNTMQFTMSKTVAGRCARCVITDNDGNVVYTEPAYISLAE